MLKLGRTPDIQIRGFWKLATSACVRLCIFRSIAQLRKFCGAPGCTAPAVRGIIPRLHAVSGSGREVDMEAFKALSKREPAVFKWFGSGAWSPSWPTFLTRPNFLALLLCASAMGCCTRHVCLICPHRLEMYSHLSLH